MFSFHDVSIYTTHNLISIIASISMGGNCNEPTHSLLDDFKCLSSISSRFAVVITNAIGYTFS